MLVCLSVGVAVPQIHHGIFFLSKWSPDVLQVSHTPLRRLTDAMCVRGIFNPDLTIGSFEAVLRSTQRSADGGRSHGKTYLVQGDIKGDACKDLGEDGAAFVRRGTRFRIQMQENLAWMLLLSAPLSMRFDALRKTHDPDPIQCVHGFLRRQVGVCAPKEACYAELLHGGQEE